MQGFYESGIKEKLDKITEFWLLNLLWVIVCLPILTIPPATFALYHVLYKWVKNEGRGLSKEFFLGFKRYFGRSYLYFIGLTIIGLSAYYYYQMAVNNVLGVIIVVGMSVTVVITVLVLIINLYVIPFNVMLEATFKKTLVLSCVFAFKHFGLTLLLAVVLFITALFVFLLPYLSILAFIPAMVYFQNLLIYRRVLSEKKM